MTDEEDDDTVGVRWNQKETMEEEGQRNTGNNMAELQNQDWAPMPHWRLALLSAFWLARSASEASVSLYLTQKQVSALVPVSQREAAFAAVGLTSSIASLVWNPVCGSLSDSWLTSHSLGRRHPFLIMGVLLHLLVFASLAVLSGITAEFSSPGLVAAALPLLSLAFLFDSLFDAIAMAPYSALIPEYVPPSQFGAASGWMGWASMLGTLLGAAGTGLVLKELGLPLMYLLQGLLLLGGMGLTVLSNEPQKNAVIFRGAVAEQLRPQDRGNTVTAETTFREDVGIVCGEFAAPFRADRNFVWIFLSRFFYNLGFDIVSSFFYFFLDDMVPAPYDFFGLVSFEDVDGGMSLFMLAFLLGSLLSSLGAGILSDRHGRKLIIYISLALQVVSASTMLWTSDYSFIAGVMAPLAGIGYGAYVSVDWALASDTFVASKDLGRDMGVWHTLSSEVPDVIGFPVAAFLMTRLRHSGDSFGISFLGHRLVLLFVILCYILSGLTVIPLRFSAPPCRPPLEEEAQGLLLSCDVERDQESDSDQQSESFCRQSRDGDEREEEDEEEQKDGEENEQVNDLK